MRKVSIKRWRRTRRRASMQPALVSEAPWYRSYLTNPISCKRANMLVTDADEIESRSAMSFVEATPAPPTSHRAFT